MTHNDVLSFIVDAAHSDSGQKVSKSPRFMARLAQRSMSEEKLQELADLAAIAYSSSLSGVGVHNAYTYVLNAQASSSQILQTLGLFPRHYDEAHAPEILARLQDLLHADIAEYLGPQLFLVRSKTHGCALVRCGVGVSVPQLWRLGSAYSRGVASGLEVFDLGANSGLLRPNFGVDASSSPPMFFKDISGAFGHFAPVSVASSGSDHFLLQLEHPLQSVALYRHFRKPGVAEGPDMWVAVPGSAHTAWSAQGMFSPDLSPFEDVGCQHAAVLPCSETMANTFLYGEGHNMRLMYKLLL